VARAFLADQHIVIQSWTSAAAGIDAPPFDSPDFDLDEVERNPLRFPHRLSAERALEEIERLRGLNDSAGGKVSCRIAGLVPGLGEPVFDKLDARLAAAMLSLGAAKGIEFGAGFGAAFSRGSKNNDSPIPPPPGRDRRSLPSGAPDLDFASNNAGGILGGLSTGMPLEFTVAFKPVPSISLPQKTVDRSGTVRELVIAGRHDVCVCPRAGPVVEAMAALVLADMTLLNRLAQSGPAP
jgi:chorismate synthase